VPPAVSMEHPVAPAPDETDLLRELDQYQPRRSRAKEQPKAKLIAPDGHELPLPASMYEVLRQAAHQLAAGLAVSIVPIGMKLSTQQTADLLGVSRPHVVKLLEQGQIPYTLTGKHRRVLLSDVLAYRDRQAGRRSEALDELARLSEDLPLT
jgi:excisionase family DNA binding protein